MKKYLFSALAMGLLMTSCQSDEPFAPVEGGEKQVTFTLTAPTSMTRAGEQKSSNLGGLSNKAADDELHYTLALYYGDNVEYTKSITSTDASVTFNPTVILGRHYRVVAYADFVGGKTDLKTIAIANGINDEKKDAYFANPENVVFTENDLAEQVTLTRPFGKLRLVATDYSDKTKIKDVSVTYRNGGHLNSFNAFKGEFPETTETTDATATYYDAVYDVEYTEATGEKTIFVDYIPVNGNGVFPFEITVTYTNGTESFKRTFAEDIPVKRNALTTLKGNFFTAEAKISVVVNENFDGGEAVNKSIVSTADQFIEAVKNVEDGETIKLFSDIVFDENARTLNSGSWYDGLYYIGDKSFTIDLNGKKISQDGSVNDYLLNFKNAASTNTRSEGSKANTITIKNGTIDAGTTAYCALCTSSAQEDQLTINLEKVNVINNISNGSTIKVRGGVILNVNEGTKIIGENSYLGIECIASTVNIKEGAEIHMNGTSSYNGCLAGVGGNGTINVYGGKGIGKKGGFIAMTSGGTINVYGGEWIANTDGTIGDNSNLYVLTAQSNKYESGFAGPSIINVTGGTFRGGMDAWVLNNAQEEKAEINISGGNFNADPTRFLDEGYRAVEENGLYNVGPKPAAKVGNTEYDDIDEAIAAWTNNTTLTLLDDVTLTDVVTLKSTEHHILNLGTYTMTAASGKNAFVIKACGTGDAERNAITIKADTNNPGGINAGSKCIVYYKYADGGISVNDRPIIKIEGGVFTGSTSSWGTAGIYTIGSEARKCATLNISGGTFNCSINGSGKSKLLISGGTFNYSVGSQGDSTALRLIWGGKFKTLGFMTADSNNTKFWFGTSMGNSNVGLYIDDDNYLVVGGPVITEFDDRFEAKATNYSEWSLYLKYSSAAEHGLYYTNAEKAIEKHGAANVVLK